MRAELYIGRFRGLYLRLWRRFGTLRVSAYQEGRPRGLETIVEGSQKVQRRGLGLQMAIAVALANALRMKIAFLEIFCEN